MGLSMRCWKRRLAVLAIVTSSLNGWLTAGFDQAVLATCPPIVDYGGKLQARAAAEVQALPAGSAAAARSVTSLILP